MVDATLLHLYREAWFKTKSPRHSERWTYDRWARGSGDCIADGMFLLNFEAPIGRPLSHSPIVKQFRLRETSRLRVELPTLVSHWFSPTKRPWGYDLLISPPCSNPTKFLGSYTGPRMFFSERDVRTWNL